nr:TPM domain-containing protein [Bacteroidota bacterium]
VLSFSGVFAQKGIPERPQPAKLVNDYANVLSDQQKSYLERKLVYFSDTTGTQVAIVIVNSLEGYDRSEFTYEIHKKWEVGQAGKDNGIVIMVKPKLGQEQGMAFISTGMGLEGVIPDITVKQIIENEMIPHFKNNNYFEGLNNAADIVMGLSSQEFTAADYGGRARPHAAISIIPLLIFLGIFILMVKARGKSSSLGHNTSFWTLLMLMSATNRRHSGSFGNFTGGGGGFGGGGGGFGGFGGGRSGGGGAGGSW